MVWHVMASIPASTINFKCNEIYYWREPGKFIAVLCDALPIVDNSKICFVLSDPLFFNKTDKTDLFDIDDAKSPNELNQCRSNV